MCALYITAHTHTHIHIPTMNTTTKKAGRPRKSATAKATREQIKDQLAKKMLEIEKMQAALTMEEKAQDYFICEYERLQEYFLSCADSRLFFWLSEHKNNFPKLEDLRTKAVTIAKETLPYGLKWDWKWSFATLVENQILPAFFNDLYKLEERDHIIR